MICRIRGGKWVPFDLGMAAAESEHPEAHLPMRAGAAIAMVPDGEVAPRHLEGVRWLAVRHRCAAFYRAKAEQRYAVASLADELTEHFGLQEAQ